MLRISQPRSANYIWLSKGRQGNLQTAAAMARLVRDDASRDEGLERFAAGLVMAAGLDSHSAPVDLLDVLFRYVQKVPYIYDTSGNFDTVQSARQTIAKGYGDCDDLAVLLATLLAEIGFRPRFVLARYKEDTRGFDHIYVDVELPDGSRIAMDPTSRNRGLGWESPKSVETVTFPIFARSPYGLGFTSGVAAAAGFAIPVWGQVALAATALIQPLIGLFSHRQQRVEETQRDQWKDEILRGMESIQGAVDRCEITPSEGVAAADAVVQQFYAACDKFTKHSVAQSCRNFETQDTPGGAQDGAFVTHKRRISEAGANCSRVAASGGAAGGGGDALAGILPQASSSTALLIIAAAVVGLVVLKSRG